MNPVGVLRAAGIGLGLGVVTSMSPAVVNVSIVDAAAAGRRRFAIGLGLGGAAADTIHAALASAGIGGLVLADPRLVRILAIAAALAIAAYAVVTWRRRRKAATAPPGERHETRPGDDPPGAAPGAQEPARPPGVQLGRGAATGFALTLLNPAALAAWVAVAAVAWPDAALLDVVAIAGGVGAGSALWFSLLAHWISRLRPDHPALAVIPRASLVLLVAIAALGVWRAL